MTISVYNKEFIKYAQTLPPNFVNLYIHDVPYGINYKNNNDYSDKKNTVDYTALESACFKTLAPDGNLIIFAGWSNVTNILLQILFKSSHLSYETICKRLEYETLDELYRKFSCWKIQGWIIWGKIKGNGTKHELISAREDIIVLSKIGQKSKFNSLESTTPKKTKGLGAKNGKKNRVLTNVWSDISPLMFTTQEYKDGKTKAGKGYKGQKPVQLMKRLIEVYSDPGDLVIDGYCGSGSTGVGAGETGRDCICTDRNKEAVQITKRRVKKYN